MSFENEAMSVITEFMTLKPRLVKVLRDANNILKQADMIISENEKLKARVSELEKLIDKSNSGE